MKPPLSADEDTDLLLAQVVRELEARYPRSEAEALVREYYAKFRDPEYCKSIRVAVQDDDFFHHQGAGDMALRVHYYLGLKGDPDPHRYLEWRAEFYRQRREARVERD